MRRILNTHTNTIHRCDGEANSNPRTSACGSLRHVPYDRTRVVSDEELETTDSVVRCGSCFEDAGGY